MCPVWSVNHVPGSYQEVAQRVSAGKGSIMMTSAGGAAQACRAVQRASNLCRRCGAGGVFCALPRAYARPGSPTRAVFARWGGLGYLLEAPPALRYFAHGDMDRLDSHVEFLKRARVYSSCKRGNLHD